MSPCAGSSLGNPCPSTFPPAGTPRERKARYATISRMSGLAALNAFPFMLRSKQSLIRSSIVSTCPLRGRYCGKREYTPTQVSEFRAVPAEKWQLTHRSELPTLLGKLSRVASSIARPRITEVTICESVISVISGTRNATTPEGSSVFAAGVAFDSPTRPSHALSAMPMGTTSAHHSRRNFTQRIYGIERSPASARSA